LESPPNIFTQGIIMNQGSTEYVGPNAANGRLTLTRFQLMQDIPKDLLPAFFLAHKVFHQSAWEGLQQLTDYLQDQK
ncbi:MAG: hypothetical protein KDD40_07010, partial [Bdellovibrionales bacterium]|nr:hypothetical protein [Bdellovibrionales bacterium]